MGEVQVCGRSNHYPSKLRTLSLTCTTRDSVLWSTSGFGEGLDNQTRVSALSLANTSLRVTTADTSTQTNTSSITLTNFNYGDHRATVTCEDYLSTDRQSVTISVGKLEIQCMYTYSNNVSNYMAIPEQVNLIK